MRIEQQFDVAAPIDRVWAFMNQPSLVAPCVPGATDVQEVDPTTVHATMKAKIGPITASVACKIAVVDRDDATHTGTLEVTGLDKRLGGAIRSRMTLQLVAAPAGTTVRIGSEIDALGKIGQLGQGLIAKRADAMIGEFVTCVRARLEDKMLVATTA